MVYNYLLITNQQSHVLHFKYGQDQGNTEYEYRVPSTDYYIYHTTNEY